MTVYHSIVCTETVCDPGVDGGPACPHYRPPGDEAAETAERPFGAE